MTEKDKHWEKIKFHAQKWRDAEKKETEIKLKIINLEVDLDRAKKDVKLYSHKTRALILVEVI